MAKKELLKATLNNLREIRELVEMGDLDANDFPLHTFRHEPYLISGLIVELKECI